MYAPQYGAFFGIFIGLMYGSCVGVEAYADIRKHNQEIRHNSDQQHH